MAEHPIKKIPKRELRVRRAANIAASRAVTGTPVNLGVLSSRTLSLIVGKATRSGQKKLAERASTALAGAQNREAARKRKKRK